MKHGYGCGCPDCVEAHPNAFDKVNAPTTQPTPEAAQPKRCHYKQEKRVTWLCSLPADHEGDCNFAPALAVSPLEAQAKPERTPLSLTLHEILNEIQHGRTAVNFGHVPSVVRALEWVMMDLQKLAVEKKGAAPSAGEQAAEGTITTGVTSATITTDPVTTQLVVQAAGQREEQLRSIETCLDVMNEQNMGLMKASIREWLRALRGAGQPEGNGK